MFIALDFIDLQEKGKIKGFNYEQLLILCDTLSQYLCPHVQKCAALDFQLALSK